ncbi:hypothetical protein NIE88_02385 [Sporolactobacillus shoreicorticis]|uniref:Uncharacterized protein n=1 Tax=Sporolactobacillus shoreicorticis TaxID=1923877 RepID=A0ABW5S2E5_9BACL|nr:hypothetical protein [Sporolactobacillus shoreicorticis]MCO7124627.1 hypothetical protein [Sporolactobacillus shoreicorticis]
MNIGDSETDQLDIYRMQTASRIIEGRARVTFNIDDANLEEGSKYTYYFNFLLGWNVHMKNTASLEKIKKQINVLYCFVNGCMLYFNRK